MRRWTLLTALALVSLAGLDSWAQAPATRSAFLVPMPREASWQEIAFLAAIPAAAEANGGKPVVLAVGEDGALSPPVRDFLRRWHPQRVTWLGGAGPLPAVDGAASIRIEALSADEAACEVASEFSARSRHVVIVRDDDYAAALAAVPIASRLRAPLLVCGPGGLSASARRVIDRLGPATLIAVGDVDALKPGDVKVSIARLRDCQDMARWLRRQGTTPTYIAAVAPSDRTAGHVRKLSLAGAALAAGRRGALVTLGTRDAPAADAAAAQATLAEFRKALGATPEFLCLAGMPEAIPMPAIPSGEGIDKDPPSDLSYGNTDSDLFTELSVGRFVAESAAAGTLLAARSLVYDDLVAPEFVGRCATAEWERVGALPLANVGFAAPSLHDGEKPVAHDSPLTSVGALIHNAHSSWLQLGKTYFHDSEVLMAPCLVESAGCSPASLDQDPEHRSVALRLLRNGAVGFVGNVRRAVAQQEIFRTEFWNAVLAGRSLGQANRYAQNRMVVSVLVNGEAEHGLHRYELYNEAYYGDPAMVLRLPAAPKVAPARVEVDEREVTVHAPAQWWRGEEFIPPDWKYDASPSIYSWRGAGVGVESSWDAAHKRNRDDLIFTAEVRTRRRVTAVVPLKPPPAPLGLVGGHAVDEHSDGTRSVWFRVRLIDADVATGVIRQQVDTLRFRID